MTSLRVLVLDNHSLQRNRMVSALQCSGVSDILLASSGKQALASMQRQGGVDIVLFDLIGQQMDCLDFLNCAKRLSLVQVIIIYCEFLPQLRRAIEHMVSFSGLKLLGILSTPIHVESLQKILLHFKCGYLQDVHIPVPAKTLPSESDIRRGLALGEFCAFYQPKLMLADSRVAGVEVLACWQHPVHGLLLPKDFLAAVLAYDLIDEMFKQLLEKGLGLLRILDREEHPLELSFNLHASQLEGSALIEHIRQALLFHNLPGAKLTFELAENGLLEMSPDVQENLLCLRMMGGGLSIDDFGVGFSSLKSLCQFAFTEIKLDGEFVRCLHEPRSRAVISTTIALARSLNMKLIIEGVSEEKEHQALIAMGCVLGQGFYYAKPMSSHELLLWLQSPALLLRRP
ncbi:EAL domain-containing protein [Pseudomonas sp. Q1]|uniref:EAL domain-containing response regulator n=1 Tax=Pseudomonas sp. Q1 TaxID=2202823 RepID=UPI0013753465|nr:EAL domain-containing protein [Pseudomonas sp. Q1]NCE83787.1 diguanylate phosphodiesterase [Pseudomonas sp. Q1]